MALNKSELEWILMMLQSLGEAQGNAGCNDLEIEDTPENRKLLVLATVANTKYQYSPDWDLKDKLEANKAGYLLTMDFIISSYLEGRLQEEIDLFN